MRNLIVNECGDKCPFFHTQYGEDDYEYYEFCVLAEFNNLPENAICGAKPEWCPLTCPSGCGTAANLSRL